MNQPGGILVRFADQISAEDRILLQTVARVLISDEDGPLSDQLEREERPIYRKGMSLSCGRFEIEAAKRQR